MTELDGKARLPTEDTLSRDADDDTEDDKKKKFFSWREVALILDRVFMYLFILVIVLATAVCVILLIVGGQYS